MPLVWGFLGLLLVAAFVAVMAMHFGFRLPAGPAAARAPSAIARHAPTKR